MDIFQAARTGNVTRIRELLAAEPTIASRRAFVNQQKRNEEPSEDCLTPLHFAAAGGHETVVRILIAAGADINFQNPNGDSPLHYAAINGQAHIVTALMQAGADINLRGLLAGLLCIMLQEWATRMLFAYLCLLEQILSCKMTLAARPYTGQPLWARKVLLKYLLLLTRTLIHAKMIT